MSRSRHSRDGTRRRDRFERRKVQPRFGAAVAEYSWEHPASVAICDGQDAYFEGYVYRISDEAEPDSYQWQSRAPAGSWTDMTGETDVALTLTDPGTGLDGYEYRLVAFFDAAQTESNAATLTVGDGTGIVAEWETQPDPQTGYTLLSVSFNVLASAGGAAISYQWQVSVGGGAFTDISGATSNSYNPGALSSDMDGNVYRCKARACTAGTEIISDGAELTVLEGPPPGCTPFACPPAFTDPGSGISYCPAHAPWDPWGCGPCYNYPC